MGEVLGSTPSIPSQNNAGPDCVEDDSPAVGMLAFSPQEEPACASHKAVWILPPGVLPTERGPSLLL